MDACIIYEGLRLIDDEDGQHILLHVEGEKSIDRLTYTMLTNNPSSFFAPLSTTENEALRYALPGKRLDTMEEPWNCGSMVGFFRQLDGAMEEAEDYLSDPKMLLLHPHAVTWDGTQAVFLLLPVLSFLPPKRYLADFCQDVLFSRGFVEEDSRFLALAFNALRTPAFDRNSLKNLIGRLEGEAKAKEKNALLVTPQPAKPSLPKKEKPFLSVQIPQQDSKKESGHRTEPLPFIQQEKQEKLKKEEKKEKQKKESQKPDKEKKTESRRTPKTILDLLMHFSLENWKDYRNQKNVSDVQKKRRRTKQHMANEATPLLWEENGHIRMMHIADPVRPRLRFSEKEEVELSSLPTILGRGNEAGILRLNRRVSGKHARFSLEHGRYMVTDWQSTNGTYVNNHRLPPFQPQTIVQGDRLRFGEEEAVFLL
ncbi:FHA domain-containing protein [Murdochiella massiliensis]|uniref:FHA domain-containing protein n=1 Tax=Murdochiella massiliensis TaxID=1673723 RepID=UPI00082D5562|nr:FHA domain-containing protein [Murdochiella massiliensis]